MRVHRFHDEDLRILATLAIDLCLDDMVFKVVRVVDVKDNYWSFDCRFALRESELETKYDSFHFDCGRDNDPTTYQMRWTQKRGDEFNIKPICSPLVVVHYFEELCKKMALTQN